MQSEPSIPSEPHSPPNPPSVAPGGLLARLHLPELAILAAMALASFRPLLAKSQGWLINTPDIYDYFFMIDSFILRNLDRGQLPLWNSHIFCGVPFLANPQTVFFYPPRLAALLLAGVAGTHGLIALHAFMAAAFMLIRLRALGFSRAACLVGGLSYGFGGYIHSCVAAGHLTMLWTMAWIPLVIHFQEWSWRRPGFAPPLLCGLALAMQIFGGEPQTTYYTVLLMALNGFVRVLEVRTLPFLGRCAVQLGVSWMLAGLFAAVQLLPLMEYSGMSDRAGGTPEFASSFPFEPKLLLIFMVPVTSFDPEKFLIAGREFYFGWEGVAYPGVITLFFALCGLTRFRARGYARFVVPGVLGIFLAMGGHTPVFRLLYAILPGLGQFRITGRAMLLVLLSIAHLAPLGCEAMAGVFRDRRLGRMLRTAMACVLIGHLATWTALSLSGDLKMGAGHFPDDVPLTLGHPVCHRPILIWMLTFGFLLVSWKRLPALYGACAVALLCMDLWLTGSPPVLVPQEAIASAPAPPETVWKMTSDGAGPRRVDAINVSGALMNSGMRSGMENVNGYWPMMPGRFKSFVEGLMNGPFPDNRRSELPTQFYDYSVGARYDLLNSAMRYRVEPETGRVASHEYPSPLPRAWFVARHRVATEKSESLAAVMSPAFDPRREVVVEDRSIPAGADDSGTTPAANVAFEVSDEDEIELRVSAPEPGWVVVSQGYFPGWACRVDGARARLVPADHAFTAFHVEAGDHHVVMRYRPWSLILGAAVSVMTLIAAGAGLVISSWRARRHNPAVESPA